MLNSSNPFAKITGGPQFEWQFLHDWHYILKMTLLAIVTSAFFSLLFEWKEDRKTKAIFFAAALLPFLLLDALSVPLIRWMYWWLFRDLYLLQQIAGLSMLALLALLVVSVRVVTNGVPLLVILGALLCGTVLIYGFYFGAVGVCEDNCSEANIRRGFETGLYFSIITFTTTGYGDLKPQPTFRLLAASEALAGYVFKRERRLAGLLREPRLVPELRGKHIAFHHVGAVLDVRAPIVVIHDPRRELKMDRAQRLTN